jgi:hypothetical protein
MVEEQLQPRSLHLRRLLEGHDVHGQGMLQVVRPSRAQLEPGYWRRRPK